MGSLRLILALSVVVAHVPGLTANLMTGGAVSVQCFYIISGFLISLILNEKYVSPGATYIFYSNRLLRIFPLYWIFLTIAFLVSIAAYVVAHKGALTFWLDNWSRLGVGDVAFLVCTNLLLFGQDLTLFLRLGESGLEWTTRFSSDPGVIKFLFIPQGWSIGLELAFYLIAPFIVRRSSWVIGLIIAASLATRTIAYVLGFQSTPWSYCFFPFEVSLFLAGAIAYRLGEYIKGAATHRTARILAFGIMPAVILFPLYSSGVDIFFSASRTGLFLYLVIALPVLYRLTKDAAWDRMAGELSYPVYLCHLIPIQLLQGSSSLAPHPGVRAILAVVATLALAAVATKYVEVPLDNFRQRRIHRSTRHASIPHVPSYART